MSKDSEMFHKTGDFRPLISCLNELAQSRIKSYGFQPLVAIVQNEQSANVTSKKNNVLSLSYFKSLASDNGINTKCIYLPTNCSEFLLLDSIKKLNRDPSVHGIFVELPDHAVDHQIIFDAILPCKDISGLNKQNIESFLNKYSEIQPCIASAIIKIIEGHDISLKNAKVLVIGSRNFSFSISQILMYQNAVFTVHQCAENVVEEIGIADIVISEHNLGSAKRKLKPNAFIIECSLSEDGKGDEVPLQISQEKVLQISSVIAALNVHRAGQKMMFDLEWKLSHIPLNFGSPGSSDIEITRNQLLKDIDVLAKEIGLYPHEIELYGDKKAKISLSVLERCKFREPGKYIVVSGITPTPLGEGKSTTSIGLCQALSVQLNKNTIVCLRQPSQGPTFGIKGGAAGGGYSQVVPMEDFNLHLTGDTHAVTAANNLLAAQIDARIFHEATQNDENLYNKLIKCVKGKKEFSNIQINRLKRLGIDKTDPDSLTSEERSRFARLDIDPTSVTWHRVIDTNDRYLRKIIVGLSPTEKNISRETQFDIAVASEVMAILALTSGLADMKEKLGKIVVANDRKGNPVLCDDLGVTGALAVLLKDTLLPNMMQTLEGAPVFVHAGPFANIAHGNSSIIADKMALKLVGKDGFVVTEAGFGADVGLEKFCDIKCRYSGLRPDVVVIVATVRALKLHGGGKNITSGAALPKEYVEENIPLVEKGYCNLAKHIQIAKKFGLPVVIALNRFSTDTDAELNVLKTLALKDGAFACVTCSHFSEGSKGAIELAKAVIAASQLKSNFQFLYNTKATIKEKIEIISKEIYGADEVEFSSNAAEKMALFEKQGYGDLPICMAKTPLSLSHDPAKKGVPVNFTVPIQDMKLSAGAGFIYPLLGSVMTMPGLGIRPNFYDIDIDAETGNIEGLS